MADVVVAGAGMGGLVTAAHAAGRGADVLVLEKAGRTGGSMLLSSGVIWRHRDFEAFRAECSAGDPVLQRLVFERLDEDLAWLETLGARVVERGTRNPITTGMRFDPVSLTEALGRAGGEPRLGEPLRRLPRDAPVVLATGGFPADRELVRRHITPEAGEMGLRAARGGTGDGLRLGLRAGGAASAGLGEFYGRNMPAPPARPAERDFVPAAQLYARAATVTNSRGERYAARTWSEVDVTQWTARQPGARAWFAVPDQSLDESVRGRPVSEMIDAARRLGAPVERAGGVTKVETVASITTTLGGLRIDERCQVAPGVFACGDDAGGIATGGYASGLAAALVLGRVAADAALGA